MITSLTLKVNMLSLLIEWQMMPPSREEFAVGAYIYRTTTTKTARIMYRSKETGELVEADANAYEYAYKPSSSDWGDFNRKMEQRLIEPARRAFRRLDKKPHELMILCHDGKIELGSTVYRSRGAIAVNDLGFGDYYPAVGNIVSVKRRGAGLSVDSLKARLDHGLDSIHTVGTVNGHYRMQIVREGDSYTMRCWPTGGQLQRHLLDVNSTDNERLLAHWTGFQREAMRAPAVAA